MRTKKHIKTDKKSHIAFENRKKNAATTARNNNSTVINLLSGQSHSVSVSLALCQRNRLWFLCSVSFSSQSKFTNYVFPSIGCHRNYDFQSFFFHSALNTWQRDGCSAANNLFSSTQFFIHNITSFFFLLRTFFCFFHETNTGEEKRKKIIGSSFRKWWQSRLKRPQRMQT